MHRKKFWFSSVPSIVIEFSKLIFFVWLSFSIKKSFRNNFLVERKKFIAYRALKVCKSWQKVTFIRSWSKVKKISHTNSIFWKINFKRAMVCGITKPFSKDKKIIENSNLKHFLFYYRNPPKEFEIRINCFRHFLDCSRKNVGILVSLYWNMFHSMLHIDNGTG